MPAYLIVLLAIAIASYTAVLVGVYFGLADHEPQRQEDCAKEIIARARPPDGLAHQGANSAQRQPIQPSTIKENNNG